MSVDARIQAFAGKMHAAGDWSTAGPIWNIITRWLRYLGFLRVVLERYEAANTEWGAHMRRQLAMSEAQRSGTTRTLTAEEMKEFNDLHASSESLHLEVETFYQFAKILVDRVADVICLYFGHPRPKDGSSLSRLVPKPTKPGAFAHICATRSLDGSSLLPLLEALHHRIVRYETDVIEHLAEPRLSPGTGSGSDWRALISMGLIAPTPGEAHDPRPTEDPAVLLAAIEDFITAAVAFLEANIDKSAFGDTRAR